MSMLILSRSQLSSVVLSSHTFSLSAFSVACLTTAGNLFASSAHAVRTDAAKCRKLVSENAVQRRRKEKRKGEGEFMNVGI